MVCLKLLCFLVVISQLVSYNSANYSATWDSLDSRPLPQWYDESKIGIFIHWGLFSVPSFASEWFWYRWKAAKNADVVQFMNDNYRPDFTYADFATQFTAEFYDPKQWADIFKASGAKYVVLTTKHHEGFTLWPSKYSWNWNAMDVGPNRDLVGDLEKAIKGVGIRFGVYHSLYEWFNPLYLRDKAANYTTNTFVTTKSRRELEELVNNYKPDIVWSDGDDTGLDEYWQSKEFLAWLYNESPVKDSVVVNDRWGLGCSCKHGGFYNCQDRYNPSVLPKHKWENAMTLHKDSWGYIRNAKLSDYLTTHQLLSTLAQTIRKYNILINVGPTPDGTIIPLYEQRLRDLGHWLSINGEAIYNSKPWTHQNDTKTTDIWYTMNGKNVYSNLLFWPSNNEVELGSVPFTTVSSISLLGRTGSLEIKSGTGGHTVVKFPILNPDSQIKWTYVLKIVTK